MKQLLLALVLVATPVAIFTGFQVYDANNVSAATTGLGDLSSFRAIMADVQANAAKGDLGAAANRITDYESAWDQAETALRPLNSTYWGNIDAASDAALKALRDKTSSADKVSKTLTALMTVLNDPAQPAR